MENITISKAIAEKNTAWKNAQALRAQIRDIEKNKIAAINIFRTGSNAAVAETLEQIDKLRADLDELKAQLERAELSHAIARHNLRIAYIVAAIPVIKTVLSKYNNKPYGPKTKQRISDEIFEQCNCRVYIGGGSYIFTADSITLLPEHENQITLYTARVNGTAAALVDNNNRINAAAADTLIQSPGPDKYIHDISAYIDEYEQTRAAALAAISQANKAISDFNNMCVLPDYNIRTIYR